jgi:2-methylcitrate dehydratase PrpD
MTPTPQVQPADDVEALAAYVLAPDDEILAGEDTTTWAIARLIDGLAIIAHGAAAPIAALARTALLDLAPTAQAHVWPGQLQMSFADTAYLLGVYAFGENYSDTGLGSVGHVGSIVIPAALVAAQQRPVSGRELLAAITVGYNVMEYAGITLNGGDPRMAHQVHGFRPTSTVGPLAGAAVLARLARLAPAQCADALSIACSQGGGLRRNPIGDDSAIFLHSGEALRRAVTSVAMARTGVKGGTDTLWGAAGFFAAYLVGLPGSVTMPVAGAGAALMAGVSLKSDCTPHTFATVLDAARSLSSAVRDLAAIRWVRVSVPEQHYVISGGVYAAPCTFAEAAADMRLCVAIALATGSHLYPSEIEKAIGDPAFASLASRVEIVVEPQLTELFNADPTSWPARIDITQDRCPLGAALDRPDSSSWSAAQTVDAASAKAVGIGAVDGAVSAAELVGLIRVVTNAPDAWAAIAALPFVPGCVDGA